MREVSTLLSNDLFLSKQNEIIVLHRFQRYHLDHHHQQPNHFSLLPGIDSKDPNEMTMTINEENDEDENEDENDENDH